MENLKIGEQEFEFFSYTGEVLSQGKFSETHVSGGGGGGAHGHSRDVHISSTVVTQHEFWLKTDDGKEVSVKLTGHDIPLREGQRVTVVYMQNVKFDSGYAALLMNHTAGEYWKLIRDTDLPWLRVDLSMVSFWFSGLAVCTFLGIIGSSGSGEELAWLILGGIGAFLWAVFGSLVVPYLKLARMKEIRETMINPHLDQIAKTFLK